MINILVESTENIGGDHHRNRVRLPDGRIGRHRAGLQSMGKLFVDKYAMTQALVMVVVMVFIFMIQESVKSPKRFPIFDKENPLNSNHIHDSE